MNAKSGSGGSDTFIWGLVAGFIVVLVAAGLYLSGLFGGSGQQAEQGVPETTEPDTGSAETDIPSAEAESQAAETSGAAGDAPAAESADQPPLGEDSAIAAVAAPVLDQIFLEPDGNAVLSGSAAPGSEVHVLLDGETVHSFTVDDSGQFAEFVSIPFADDARGLVLETPDGEGTRRSDDYLIAALTAPVTPVAPEPAAAPDQEVAEAQAADAEPNDQQATGNAASDEGASDAAGAEEPPADTTADTTAPEIESRPETGGAADQSQVAILRSGEEGVELVQPPTVQETPPEQIALDTIGYSEAGDVELTGRARDGSVVRLYLDNRLVADIAPATGGQWRGEVAGIDPGVYTLRVDEVAPDGTVVSRLETPFKREPVEALRATEAGGAGDAPTAARAIRLVTVQRGDTLWAISRDRFGDGILYVKLFEANRDSIRDPDLIYPGQIFTIPE